MNKDNNINIICLGDVVGRSGRRALEKLIPSLKEKYNASLVIVNGENAAGGVGLDTKTALEIKKAGVDVITLGDHTWQRKEFFDYLDKHPEYIIRPANYPEECLGRGWTIVESQGIKIGIFNLIGRVFIQGSINCPFKCADNILQNELSECDCTICDIHAEATSEKQALARYLDGRATLIFGTHTHIQTADECILPKGSAYISDLGMCGSMNGILGMDSGVSLARFITGIQYAYKCAKGNVKLNGIVCSIDKDSKQATAIQRISIECPDEE